VSGSPVVVMKNALIFPIRELAKALEE